MKKSIFSTIIIATIILVSSCQTDIEETRTPTFKLTSFHKELVNGVYQCTATFKVTDIPEQYSIDGILYANDITNLYHNIPYNETLQNDYYKIENNKYYFNLYGKHKGNIQFTICWASKDDRNDYLVGFHLVYGFGENCEVLMINLEK